MDFWWGFGISKWNVFVLFLTFFCHKNNFNSESITHMAARSFIICRTHSLQKLGKNIFSIFSKLTILFKISNIYIYKMLKPKFWNNKFIWPCCISIDAKWNADSKTGFRLNLGQMVLTLQWQTCYIWNNFIDIVNIFEK